MPLHYAISLDDEVIEHGQIQNQQSTSDVTVVNGIIKAANLHENRSYMMNVATNIYSQNVQISDHQIFSEF